MHVPNPALLPTGVTGKDWVALALRTAVLVVLTVAFPPLVVFMARLAPTSETLPGLLLLGWGAAWLISGVALLAGIARVVTKARAKSRFDKGRYTPQQSNELARVANLNRSEDQARELATALVRGEPCSIGKVWDVTLEPDETIHFDGQSGYARFYAMDVTYTQSSGFYFGSPLFVAAGLAGDAIANARARDSALRMAAQQWREHQWVRFVVTSQRIIVRRRDATWLNFWYGGVHGVYPRPEEGMLFLEFEDTSPLRIEGPAAAVAAVAAVWARHGVEGLNDHPGLDYLHTPGNKFLQ